MSAAPELLQAGTAEADLRQARELLTGFEQAHFAARLQQIAAQRLSPAQALELDAFRLMGAAVMPETEPQALLLKARELLTLAQLQQALLAEAAIWRAIQWLQTRMKLHHAALESVAMAGELYMQAGEHELARLMRVSRCPVLFMAEMYPELREACATLMQQREDLPAPAYQLLLNNGASAAYYLANEEEDAERAQAFWRECLELHGQSLAFTRVHGLVYAGLVAHLNLAVVNATLGRCEPCRAHLAALREGCGDQPLQASWQLWAQLCEVLLLCHEGAPEQAWPALLALEAALDQAGSNSVGHREAWLHALRRFGRRWGHDEVAMQAALTLLRLERQRKRELSRALGETVNAVIERPHLLHENEQLARQGSELELSLAQRNQELSGALAKVQAEASIRAAAEVALQRAHDELERQVEQRSAELAEALRTLMQQEKQLALSRMVVGVAHEMNTPLGNARMAASTVQARCQSLIEGLAGNTLRRLELAAALEALSQSGAVIDRALDRAGELVQRFKALSISQHSEACMEFDLIALLRGSEAQWRETAPEQAFSFKLDGPASLSLRGYPGALKEVWRQLFENSVRHGWQGRGDDARLLLVVQPDGDQLQLDWQDNGRGIAAEHLDHVMEPFYTTQLGQSGTGLGLSTVNSLVCDLMRGQVEVHSSPGLGCLVRMRLPLRAPR
ncbi:HAMP domain-containing sensor histidine kinase [Paucibacter sp. APW11]|uniref:histidine kinase n=1 Tax=Roseateles aquae TaxID=3077235 RepID=A0ABU3PEB5_9BURK|nr:HAMP domain-containing sensor histidine kinase [Paucibacter sp. APW11]MDT9000612.1 HAMP domain-containing sensor histidine kinase [Paucibacter sp. APW11]